MQGLLSQMRFQVVGLRFQLTSVTSGSYMCTQMYVGRNKKDF